MRLSDAMLQLVPQLDGKDSQVQLVSNSPSFEIAPVVPVKAEPPLTLKLKLKNIVVAERIRQHLDPQKIESLANSIRQHGFRGVLWVRLVNGRYHLIAGGRRYEACRLAGIAEVPVEVWDITDAEAIQLELLENFQREDLNPIEEAEGVLRMLEITLELERSDVIALLRRKGRQSGSINTLDTGDNVVPNSMSTQRDRSMIQAQVTDQVLFEQIDQVFSLIGKYSAESFRTHRLPLLNLPKSITEAIRTGRLEYTKARLVARIKDDVMREQALSKVIREGLSFAEVDKLVKHMQEEAETQVAKPLNEDQQFHTRANGVFKRLKTAKLEPPTRKKVESLLTQLEELLKKE